MPTARTALAFVTALTLSPAVLPASQAPPASKPPLTRPEVEALVRADAARLRGTKAEAVTLVSTESRIWKGRGLGCGTPRKGLDEEIPSIEGFLVKVSVGAETLSYHTDRTGRVLLCPTTRKPVDRISY
jgi:hypothetical protein